MMQLAGGAMCAAGAVAVGTTCVLARPIVAYDAQPVIAVVCISHGCFAYGD